MKFIRPGTILALAWCVAACGDKGAATSSAQAADSARPSSAPSASASAAQTLPKGTPTKGTVKTRSKESVAFSLELPAGIKDVSDNDVTKDYRKDAKVFDVSFTVMDASPEWVKAGLDGTLAEASKSPDFVKNQAKVLDKGTLPNGWYFGTSIQEGGKQAVLLWLVVTKGDKSLTCNGGVEGPDAATPEKALATLLNTCKTLQIE